ncbi:hypothetical protein BY458DRAFT_503261 [Sporodiniella umbellata]|nr:hypothetical protein BY458DRAFT_503261 [Sporodiniella umbellata]
MFLRLSGEQLLPVVTGEPCLLFWSIHLLLAIKAKVYSICFFFATMLNLDVSIMCILFYLMLCFL